MLPFLMLLVLLLLLLQAVEIWRRFRFPTAITPGQFRRRLATAAILEASLLMWIAGDPLMRHQPPLTQLAYWCAVPLLVFAAAFSAIREMGEVTRQYHHQRAELYRGAGDPDGETRRLGEGARGQAGEGPAGRPADRASE
jgi:hypothetical protein